MTTFQRALALLLLGLILGVLLRPAQAQDSLNLSTAAAQRLTSLGITVGDNVQVSTALEDRAHFELNVAAHPSNPEVLLSAGMVWSEADNQYDIAVYRTSDGGRNWSHVLNVDPDAPVQDPTLAFGSGGWAYFGEFGGEGLRLHRSDDGGQGWSSKVTSIMDRPWVSVSPPGTPHEGRVYIHGIDGEQGADVALQRAKAHGTTFLPTKTFDLAPEEHEVLTTGPSTVLSDGTLAFPYLVRLTDPDFYEAQTAPPPRTERRPNAALGIAVSRDGGKTVETTRVARWYHRFGRGRTATVPTLAADTTEGPFKNRLYVAWTDFRTGEGQVFLSHSDQPTEQWSSPIVVNRSGGPAFHPTLAVNRRGVLGISWYDRRNSASGLGWEARFAASTDGGVTVHRSVRVSDQPFRYSWDGGLVILGDAEREGYNRAGGYLHHFNEMGGHTAGLTADADGDFHPVWVGNPTGVPQMWSASVSVEGEAHRHGTPSLSALHDLTSKTALAVENAEYNDSTHVATLKVRLRNVSRDTLQAPMALKVINLWSEFGEVRLVGPQGSIKGHGAVLPITEHLTGRRLLPRSSTAPFTIEGKIRNPKELGPMQPPPPGRRIPGYGVLEADVQVLGRSSDRP